MNRKVALLLPSIPPYRLEFLDCLNDELNGGLVVVSTSSFGEDFKNAHFSLMASRSIQVPISRGLQIPWNLLPDLRTLSPDLVVSSEMGCRTLQALLYCWTRRIPLIVWAKLSEHTERYRGGSRKLLRRFLFSKAAGVIVNGKSGERYVRQVAPRVERIAQIPYTTSLMDFSSMAPLPFVSTRKILTVGQFIERKGLFQFGELLANWLDKHSDSHLEWSLIGAGTLEELLKSNSWHPRLRVTVFPKVDYVDLPTIFHRHGLFAFPTLEDEWGVVVMEAMAAGVPVLGSIYSEAVNDLIAHGRTGWRFDPLSSDPSTNLAILDEVFRDREETKLIAEAARCLVWTLSPEILARRFAQFINACQDGSPRNP